MTGKSDDQTLLEMGEKWGHRVRNIRFDHNCVFGFSLDNGKIINADGFYCHGGVQSPSYYFDDSRAPIAINTRIQKDSIGYQEGFGRDHGGLLSEEYFHKYYDFLFNRSMFSECYVTKSTEGLREGGVVVVRCDKPANLMAAACVAIRRGWEYTSMSRSLINMLEMGIEPNLAHIVSYQLIVKDKENFREIEYRGHQSIYSKNLNKNGVRNILSGKLPNNNKYNKDLYINIKTYSGLEQMWNTVPSQGRLNTLNFKCSELESRTKSDPFGLIAYIGRSKKSLDAVIEEGLSIL